MTTTTFERSLQEVLEQADPNKIADGLRKVGIGYAAALIRVTVTGVTAASSFDISTAAFRDTAGVTVAGITLEGSGNTLPPVGACLALQVTASGTATSVGAYILAVDSATAIVPPGGANAGVGVATISDDGNTITFPNTVTGFELHYMARSREDLTAQFAPSV